jgi:all-trans-retinol 13,14-reductase
MNKTVIIIGGGIGGLFSACLLCKEGYKPIIMEQHGKIGGGLHCFERYGELFESGIHFVSGFEEKGPLRKLFSYLNLLDKIHLKTLDKHGFDIIQIGSEKFNIGIGKENFIRIFSKSFPEESQHIREYIDVLYTICDHIPLFNLQPISDVNYLTEDALIPVGQFINKYIKDEKLQKILAWNNPLYGGNEEQTPIYIHAIITKFYIEGASRFIGGSQHVADAMATMIIHMGGEIHLNKEIVNIEVDNKKITKVIAKDGSEYKADYYISDIHPSLLMDLIHTENIQKAYRERLKQLKNTHSSFLVYVKFKPNHFPYLNHNYYYYNNYDMIWNTINYHLDDFPSGFILMTSPSKNQGKYANKAIVHCIMRYENFQQWENTYIGKRGLAYESFKKEIENKIIDKVNEVFPNFEASIDKVFSGSPLTIRDYLRSKDGSLYGYKKNYETIFQTRILPRTKIENLFLTGQNINLHGILGVPLSAIITVGIIIGDVNYLINKINNNQ